MERKIVAMIATAILLTATAVIGVSSFFSLTETRSAIVAQSAMVGSLLAENSAGAVRFGKVDALTASASAVVDKAQGRIAALSFFGKEGNLLAVYPGEAPTDRAAAVAATALETEVNAFDQTAFKDVLLVRFGKKNDIVGAIVIDWSWDSILSTAIDDIVTTLSVALASCLLVTLAIFVALKRMGFRPFADLSAVAREVVRGDVREFPHLERKDVIGRSMRALQTLSEKIRWSATSAERVAAGDLSVRMTNEDDQDRLGAALQAMVLKLDSVIGEAGRNAQSVAELSGTLDSLGADFRNATTREAGAAQQASAAVEEMTANIRQSADNASQTEKIAIQSADEAEKSGAAVNDAVSAMKTIAERITIIQEIARQTDLLALNAAVEAARAGEHGRGFAVVASEVRKLAERSQTAAAEISELSARTVSLSGEAGRMLETLVPNIQRTADLVQEISAATREQNTGAEQISQAIRDLGEVIRQNAAAATRATETSDGLARESEQLNGIIGAFEASKTGAASKDPASASHAA